MNNYNIILLGPSGAGKTIFLASLFRLLSTYSQEKYGFFVEVEETTRKTLNKIYAQLVNDETWPRGTSTVTKWNFTCCVKNKELINVPICKFTYVDYSGGLVTDPQATGEDDNFNLGKEIQNADAVWAMIDGQKILSFMQDQDLMDKKVLGWMEEDLANVMQLIDNKCTKKTLVHFIISKWDLFDEKTYPLSKVKNRLLDKVTDFRNVVGNRKKAKCSVQLIPVSSVGRGFATLQSDGQMKKNSGTTLQPLWVDVPLALVLKDKLHQLGNSKLQLSKNEHKSTRLSSNQRNLGLGLCFLLGLFLVLSRQFILFVLLIIAIIFWERYRNSQMRDNNTELNHLEQTCKNIIKEFLRSFPDSNL